MSDSGSFVTEYIYCDKCFEAAKKALLRREKYMCSTIIPSWAKTETEGLPIIAGKIGGLYSGEEIDSFEQYVIPDELEPVICHPLRIAVLAESGSAILWAYPKDWQGETNDATRIA
jgi:hypothetical protein